MINPVETILESTEGLAEKFPSLKKFDKYRHQAVELGDRLEGPAISYLIEKAKKGRNMLGPAARAAFSVLSGVSSRKYLESKQKSFFKNIPLMLPNGIDGRTFKKIGSGTKSTVYFLNEQENAESAAVLVDRQGFSKTADAERYVAKLMAERHHFASMFGNDSVVEELPFIWEDNKSQKRVTIARPFKSPIKDAFSLNPEEYEALFEKNPNLRRKINSFVNVFEENAEELLVDHPLDLVGKDNLVICGEGDQSDLLLLDPHERNSGNDLGEVDLILSRIQYLKTLTLN